MRAVAPLVAATGGEAWAMRAWAWCLVPVLLLAAACSNSRFEPPERSGPIGLVDTGNGKQLWLALVQEEERSRHVGGGSLRIGRWVTEYRYHLRLQAHDRATAQRLWSKDLKVVRDRDGGRSAQIRILGHQGEIVPAAVRSRQATVQHLERRPRHR